MEEIKDLLGGYNCGGCGYEDCSHCAEAILKGEAPANMCPMIDEENVNKIEEIVKNSKK